MQIGGPTGAFVVIVPGIVSRFGIARLSLVTLLAGVLLVIMEVTGFGSAVKFIRRPVIIGFTNGIALLIASTPFRGLPQENQIKDFLGLRTGLVPSSLVQWQAVAVAGSTLAIVLLWLRLNRRIPGSILPC